MRRHLLVNKKSFIKSLHRSGQGQIIVALPDVRHPRCLFIQCQYGNQVAYKLFKEGTRTAENNDIGVKTKRAAMMPGRQLIEVVLQDS